MKHASSNGQAGLPYRAIEEEVTGAELKKLLFILNLSPGHSADDPRCAWKMYWSVTDARRWRIVKGRNINTEWENVQ